MPLILHSAAAENRFQISNYDPVCNIDHEKILLFDGDTTIEGDMDAEWVSRTLEAAGESPDDSGLLVIVNGNLTVTGDIRFSDYRPALLVLGDLHCHVLKSGDESIHISGNATIKYAYYGYYNDGSISIAGKTTVPYVLNSDHHSDLTPVDSVLINVYSDDDDFFEYDFTQKDLAEVILPELMKDSFSLNVWAFIDKLKTGASPFKPGATTPRQAAADRLAQLVGTDPLSVTELDLTNQKFTAFPGSITALKNLRKLTLSENRIKTIPVEINSLEHLEELYLKNCALESIALHADHTLRVLDVSQNRALTGLPELRHLQVLNIDYNQLHLTQPLPSLEEIGMYACYTDGNDPAPFPTVLLQSRQLRKLDLRQNRFRSLPVELTLLPLEEILWTDSTSETPLPDFSACTTLKRLVLSKSFAAWRHMVFNIPTLEYLKLDRNGEEKEFFDADMLDMWKEMAADEPEKYDYLLELLENKQLEADGRYSVISRQGISTEQLQQLSRLPNLTYLDLGWNKLETLPESLYGLTKLTYLNLKLNKLSPEEQEKVKTVFKDAEVHF